MSRPPIPPLLNIRGRPLLIHPLLCYQVRSSRYGIGTETRPSFRRCLSRRPCARAPPAKGAAQSAGWGRPRPRARTVRGGSAGSSRRCSSRARALAAPARSANTWSMVNARSAVCRCVSGELGELERRCVAHARVCLAAVGEAGDVAVAPAPANDVGAHTGYQVREAQLRRPPRPARPRVRGGGEGGGE